MSRDATSSRVLDVMLSSPTTPPREVRKFLMSLIGHYHTLADDRIGSRVAERCWQTADVYLKDKIAASLVDQLHFLQGSQYGHFFARRLDLPLWQRRKGEWKAKMAALDAEIKGLKLPGQQAEGGGTVPVQQGATSSANTNGRDSAEAGAGGENVNVNGDNKKKRRKRDRPKDEVDEIFETSVKSKNKKGRHRGDSDDEDDEAGPSPRRAAAPAVPELEDVFQAIKASAE